MKRMLSFLLAANLLLALGACSIKLPHDIPQNTDDPSSAVTDQIPADPQPDVADPPVGDNSAEPPQQENEDPPPVEDETPPAIPDEEDEPQEPEEYIRTIDPYAPMVALTFDDGPHELYSSQILDILEQHHAVATFFEVGYNACRYPEILKRMAELGCEIASHTYYHHDLTTLSKDAMLTDLAMLDKIILDATGEMPTLVRPPYGAVNSTVKNESGRAMILWTVDTKDWLYRDAQTLIDYMQNYGNLDGEIVLMHSIHASTAEAMVTLVPWLIEQGYQLVTVSELMAYYYGVLLEPNKFYNQTWFARHDRTEYPLELPAEPMQTLIPEYTTVPVIPNPPQEDEPTDPPVQDEEPSTETPPPSDEPVLPPEGEDTPPETETDPESPAEGEIPPSEDEAPPSGEDTPPAENGETTPTGDENAPPENEDIPPTEDGESDIQE